MKIERPGLTQPARIYAANKAGKADLKRPPETGDILDLSLEAKLRLQLDKELAKPEVRESQVEDLRRRIQAGSYHVDNKKVAAAVLEEMGRTKSD